MADSFQFELLKPDGQLLATEVTELVVPGESGYFGVRSDHHPMVSLLGIGVLEVHGTDGEKHYFAVSDGFCEVGPEKTVVLAEVAEAADGIDAERAQRARERAVERLKTLDAQSVDMPRAKAALSRAEVRLRVAAYRM